MLRIALAAGLGLLLGAGGYHIAQERACAVFDMPSTGTFADARAALSSVVPADPDRYVLTGDYLDRRDNFHHTEYGYFVEGELVESVNVYEVSAGSWSVFDIESCEGPGMP